MAIGAYIGAAPVNIQFGSLSIGDIIKIKEDGVPVDYIVVHQGNPSTSLYDSSCDGTWVLRKDIYNEARWSTATSHFYNNSSINTTLNSTFLDKFDAVTQSHIKTVKIPYASAIASTDATGRVMSGANGLSTKVFLLSGYEIGWTQSNYSALPIDGARLSYFTAGTGTAAKEKRIAYYNGTATGWWLRSIRLDATTSTKSVYFVNDTATASYAGIAGTHGVRPVFIMDKNTWLSDGVIVEEPSYLVTDRKVKGIYIGNNGSIKSIIDVEGTIDNQVSTAVYEWTNRQCYDIEKVEDYLQVIPERITDAGRMYHCKKYFDNPIIGRNSSARKLVLVTAMVRGYSTNVGYPWIGLYYDVKDDTGTEESFLQIATDLETGVKYTGLNDGQWHKVGMLRQTCATNGTGSLYYDYTGIAIGVASPDDNTKVSSNDKFDLKDLCVFDLTEMYGQGNEPGIDWCAANIAGQGQKVELSNLPNRARRVKKAYIGDSNNTAQLCYAIVTPEDLIDFNYTDNEDGTYTITGWKGTYQGNPSTKVIIPDGSNIIW